MILPAAGFEVGVLGGTLVGDRVDMVVLQSPSAAAVHTGPPGELRHRTQIQGGAQGGVEVPAEMLDGVDVDAIV
jgi:hypothetical protein